MSKKQIEEPFELKHVNRHTFCPACEKMYRFQIKTMEKRIEILTKMLELNHLLEPVKIPVTDTNWVKDIRESFNKNRNKKIKTI